MSLFYRTLDSYAPLVYIILVIMGMYAFRNMVRSWREWRNAVFSLEREFALRRLGQATAFGLIVLFLFFGQFYISTFVVPVLPASDIISTPTLDMLATPIATTAPNGEVSLATPAPQSGMSGCIENEKMLTSPSPGEEISGTVSLMGSASISNFGFYKYEYAPVGTDNWVTISAGAEMKVDDELGKWDTTTLTNGDYFLQLVIIDNVGNTIEPCVIAVRVINQ